MRLPAFLLLFCLALGSAAAQPERAPLPKSATPFPTASNDEAWGKLPPHKKPALPEWARILSGPLPKTTAKMLELDYFHREKNPLGPVFAAQIRRTVAGALGSKFGVATAEADLKQAGPLPPPTVAEKVALAFAKKLTEEGHAITDKEFAELLQYWDPAEVTAIVHTVAYANFHNRIVLAIGANGDPVPPVAVTFDDTAKSNAPPRPPWDDLKSVSASGLTVRVEWGKDGFDELNASLAKQQERKLRIALPDAALIEKLPPRERDSAKKILWNTVSAGYQPEMTRAWFACLSAFYEEAKVDRVFTNSVFWVVTRTNDCFY